MEKWIFEIDPKTITVGCASLRRFGCSDSRRKRWFHRWSRCRFSTTLKKKHQFLKSTSKPSRLDAPRCVDSDAPILVENGRFSDGFVAIFRFCKQIERMWGIILGFSVAMQIPGDGARNGARIQGYFLGGGGEDIWVPMGEIKRRYTRGGRISHAC